MHEKNNPIFKSDTPSLKELREGGSEQRRRAVLSVLPKPSTGSTHSKSFNGGNIFSLRRPSNSNTA
jgi:hypothetical protein